jgi:hypothetical protein
MLVLYKKNCYNSMDEDKKATSRSSVNGSESSQDRVNEILLEYRVSAENYASGHEKASRRYSRRDRYLSMPIKVLPFIATSLLIPDSSNIVYDGKSWYTMTAMLCTSLVGALAIIKGVLMYLQRSDSHKQSFLGYSEMSREIKYFMARSHSPNEVDTFAQFTEHKLSMFNKQAPNIPLDIIKKAHKQNNKIKIKNMHIRAIIEQAKIRVDTNTGKSRNQLVNHICAMSRTQMLNIIKDQQRLQSNSRCMNSDSTSAIVPVISNFSRGRVIACGQDNSMSKQDILESILLDCNLDMRSLKQYQNTPGHIIRHDTKENTHLVGVYSNNNKVAV